MAPEERNPRERGLTLLEVLGVATLLAALTGGAVSAYLQMHGSFNRSQIVSQLMMRTQYAMERLVQMSSQAVSDDSLFSPFEPYTGEDSRGLRFRLIDSLAGGAASYDDEHRVYLYGPNGTVPCGGIVLGRGPSLTTIAAKAAGSDGKLGTEDDETSKRVSSGGPAYVNVLLPEEFAPREGSMFSVNVSPSGRMLLFIIRSNARDASGNWVLEQDLEIRQRVALLQ